MRRIGWTMMTVVVVALAVAAPLDALARGCFPLAQGAAGVVPAAWRVAALPAGKTVEISYLGHSTFLIESKGGIRILTDYNGTYTTAEPPDVATMNNAHSSHYTPFPDPSIEHVLEGWGAGNRMAEHDVEIGDVRVRNIPTSVHGRAGAQANSNSIFVFEVEDLCLAHLGHLHHLLDDVHLGELGIIDVLFVPIDGGYTMSQQEMARVVRQIRPSLVIPMHYFGSNALGTFAGLLGDAWPMRIDEDGTFALSRLDLPQGAFLVLPPRGRL